MYKIIRKFCKDLKDVENITVNVDSIREKLLNRSKVLPLRDHQIHKAGDVYDAKDNQRKSEYIFDFVQPQLADKDLLCQVYGLGNGYFSVNDIWYPGSLLIFPKQVFMWDVQTAADIRGHCFDILDYIKPFPNYVIIGTGKDMVELPESYFERFKQRRIKVDVVPTFEACSNFNFCSEERRDVCAFLIPANL